VPGGRRRQQAVRSAPRASSVHCKRERARRFWGGLVVIWLRGSDLNRRPSGYEPDELPGCSTPRQTRTPPLGIAWERALGRRWTSVNGFLCGPRASMPGDDLLFHRLSDSTIGAVWFHGRVRDGIGWVTDAMATKQWSRWTAWGFKSGAVHIGCISSGQRCSASELAAPGLSLMV
jgi:hypothetical protein